MPKDKVNLKQNSELSLSNKIETIKTVQRYTEQH